MALLASPGLVLAGQVLGQESDWAEVDHRVRFILHDYYNSRGTLLDGIPQDRCHADDGDVCFGGDYEDQFCSRNPGCRTEEELTGFLRSLRTSAEESPANAYAMGQAVYAFARVGRLIEAFELAESCQAVEWWCGLLRSSVLQRSGQPASAEESYRTALAAAPVDLVCRVSDVGPLLPGSDQGRYGQESCSSRDSLDARFWWLADPLFSVAGNDRWTEHVHRRFELVLHEQILLAIRSHHPGAHETAVVKRGQEDSWDGRQGSRFVGKKGARYHFVPEVGIFGESLDGLSYRLDAEASDEGFTPTYGPVLSLPLQAARFRRGDSMEVAIASTLAETPLSSASDLSAYLILSDGPGSFPLQLRSDAPDQRAAYLARAPAVEFLGSFEVVSGNGLGRHRFVLEPLTLDGPGLSDPLLFKPVGREEPDSLVIAAGMMLGETTVEGAFPLGVYWEVYGAAPGIPVRTEIVIMEERRGLLNAIRRLLPGGSEGGTGRLSWEDPSRGSEFRKAVILSLEGLDPGRYDLIIRASWSGGQLLETMRSFQVR